eukprot:2301364-Pyramimonas_sp.AAC.1
MFAPFLLLGTRAWERCRPDPRRHVFCLMTSTPRSLDPLPGTNVSSRVGFSKAPRPSRGPQRPKMAKNLPS